MRVPRHNQVGIAGMEVHKVATFLGLVICYHLYWDIIQTLHYRKWLKISNKLLHYEDFTLKYFEIRSVFELWISKFIKVGLRKYGLRLFRSWSNATAPHATPFLLFCTSNSSSKTVDFEYWAVVFWLRNFDFDFQT